MSRIAPKPIIARVVKTWNVPPGLKFAVVEDVERQVWIVESCPAGTQCWTVAQAAQLTVGSVSRHALQEAVREGMALEAARAKPVIVPAPNYVEREWPAFASEESRLPVGLQSFRQMRRSSRKRTTCDDRTPARI